MAENVNTQIKKMEENYIFVEVRKLKRRPDGKMHWITETIEIPELLLDAMLDDSEVLSKIHK